jgi:hypothetical protein
MERLAPKGRGSESDVVRWPSRSAVEREDVNAALFDIHAELVDIRRILEDDGGEEREEP